LDSDKKIEQWVVADILNFLPDATLVIDCQGRVIAWNKAAEEMTGIKSEEILGKGDYEYSIPFYGYRRPLLVDHVLNYEQGWEDNYSYIEIKGQTIIGESLCRTKDNPQAYLWKIATPLYDIQGNINGAIESIRDVTDRRKAEDALKASEEKYRQVVENAHEGIWLNDQNGIITFANEKMASLLGYDVESMVGLSVFTFITREYQQIALWMTERSRKGMRMEHDLQFCLQDGSHLWALVSMTPIITDGVYSGPTASMLPDAFFKRGVTSLGGILVQKPDELLDIISEGGSGYHFFGKAADRLVIRNAVMSVSSRR
jgi:PAS domain S-box-containing protein